MQRVAVFVDAGYLFAQGSNALTGSKRARSDLSLDASSAIDELKRICTVCAPECSLLRIYWYDGTIGSRPTADHAVLAGLNDVKVRLGAVNSQGQQKGVDSLIVTDLIELARQKSIYDALILAGDEDVRVGVQIAQTYGVRVHLLGIFPARGSQSRELLHEADTTHEWTQEVVRRFLSERSPSAASHSAPPVHVSPASSSAKNIPPLLEPLAATFASSLDAAEVEKLITYWKTERGLPTEYDRPLLGKARDALGRDLEGTEKRDLRIRVRELVSCRATLTT